jgi:hypothetical protein
MASTDLGLTPAGRLDSVRVHPYGSLGTKEGHARRRLQSERLKFDLAEGDAANQAFLQIVLGFTLLTIGAAILFLPGPGWMTIGLGLVVLAAEFIWARRLLNRLRRQTIKPCGSASRGTGPTWLLNEATCKAEQHYQSLLASSESFHVFIRLIQSSGAGGRRIGNQLCGKGKSPSDQQFRELGSFF